MTKLCSIWGKTPMSKTQCKIFFKDLKSRWGLNYVLNEKEKPKMMNMMKRYYVSSFYPQLNKNFLKIKDKITHIQYGEGCFREPTFFFYEEGKRVPHNPSVDRCTCFGSGNTHESCNRSAAVSRAFRNAIFTDKVEWKKAQGYIPGFSPMMHAHHVDGKEFKTIFAKFLLEINYSKEELINKLYPEHMNFETCHMTYYDAVGWRFSTELGLNIEKEWIKFHRRNAAYKFLDPETHKELTAEEIKFNTSVKHKVQDILK
tara:strand:- start:49 stop:822 length:774 start_codon:yes stop_codon:yes gene_type:complete